MLDTCPNCGKDVVDGIKVLNYNYSTGYYTCIFCDITFNPSKLTGKPKESLTDLKNKHYNNLERGIIDGPLIDEILLKRLENDYRSGGIHWRNKIKRYLGLDWENIEPSINRLISSGKIQEKKLNKKDFPSLPYSRITFYFLRKYRHSVRARIHQLIRTFTHQRKNAYKIGHHLERLISKKTNGLRGKKKIDIDGQTFLAEIKNHINPVQWRDCRRQLLHLREKSDTVALICSKTTDHTKKKLKYYGIKLIEIGQQIYTKSPYGSFLPRIFCEDGRNITETRTKARTIWRRLGIKDFLETKFCRKFEIIVKTDEWGTAERKGRKYLVKMEAIQKGGFVHLKKCGGCRGC